MSINPNKEKFERIEQIKEVKEVSIELSPKNGYKYLSRNSVDENLEDSQRLHTDPSNEEYIFKNTPKMVEEYQITETPILAVPFLERPIREESPRDSIRVMRSDFEDKIMSSNFFQDHNNNGKVTCKLLLELINRKIK